MTNWQLVLRQSRVSDEGNVPFGKRKPVRVPRSAAADPNRAAQSTLRTIVGYLVTGWKWLERKRALQFGVRRLRVTETVALGEKRFVSILKVDGSEILIGSSAGGISLLAVLDKAQEGWRAPSPAGDQSAGLHQVGNRELAA